jgi:hypothetical protein
MPSPAPRHASLRRPRSSPDSRDCAVRRAPHQCQRRLQHRAPPSAASARPAGELDSHKVDLEASLLEPPPGSGAAGGPGGSRLDMGSGGVIFLDRLFSSPGGQRNPPGAAPGQGRSSSGPKRNVTVGEAERAGGCSSGRAGARGAALDAGCACPLSRSRRRGPSWRRRRRRSCSAASRCAACGGSGAGGGEESLTLPRPVRAGRCAC